MGGDSDCSNDPSAEGVNSQLERRCFFRGVCLKDQAIQMKLFNPINSSIFGSLTGDLMGATEFVVVDIVATEMTQSQISCRHYFY